MFCSACCIKNGVTGIGCPFVDAGLFTGAPLSFSRPILSSRIATAVAWSFAIPNLDMNLGIARSIRRLPATDPIKMFCATVASKKIITVARCASANITYIHSVHYLCASK
jgi:hypothetical protein